MFQRLRKLTSVCLLLSVGCGSQEPPAGEPASLEERLEVRHAGPPRLDYATYFGGEGDDSVSWMKLAPDGSVYVVGSTTSLALPGTTHVIGPGSPGLAYDGFVLKLDPDGRLAYLTRFGGAGSEFVLGVDVDRQGAAYVTGFTDSTDFPVTAGAVQEAYAGGPTDGFVVKLSPDGSHLEYSTFLGGSGLDRPFNGFVDAHGRLGIIGHTSSTDFPVKNAFQPRHGGGPFDAFVTRLDRDGDRITFSTYLGGEGDDEAWDGNLDAQGNLYLDGPTTSANFPVTRGAFQGSLGGGQDAFIAKVSPAGALLYASYFGGSGDELVSDCGLDASGSAYITGGTTSTDLPTTGQAFQPRPGGGFDGYVARVSPNGRHLEYATYVGGSGGGLEVVGGVRADARGNVYLVGTTDSLDFPITPDALQPTYGGGDGDLFVMRLDGRGALRYGTFLGGSDLDFMFGLGTGLDAHGRFTFTGSTWSSDFPTTPGALQGSNAGGPDVALVRLAFPPERGVR